MTHIPYDIQIDRIVGTIATDARNALVFERLPSGKILISKVTFSLSGQRPALTNARRTFSVPMHCLGELVALLQRLEEPSQPSHASQRVA